MCVVNVLCVVLCVWILDENCCCDCGCVLMCDGCGCCECVRGVCCVFLC